MRSEVQATDVENLSHSSGSGVLCSNRARDIRPSARTKQEGSLGLFLCAVLPVFRVAAKISSVPPADSGHATGGQSARLRDLTCHPGSPSTLGR